MFVKLHYQLFFKKSITTINMPKQTGFNSCVRIHNEWWFWWWTPTWPCQYHVLNINHYIMASQTRNFYSWNGNCHTCMVFTSRYLFSVQTRTIELGRNRLPVSSLICNMAIIFSMCWDMMSNNTKLMLIDVETNAAQNLQEKAVFTQGVNLNHRMKGTKYKLIDFSPRYK